MDYFNEWTMVHSNTVTTFVTDIFANAADSFAEVNHRGLITNTEGNLYYSIFIVYMYHIVLP